jgi:bifunctional non-homologous end joining protein LigD
MAARGSPSGKFPWFGPMLATLVSEPFSREEWIFEPKLDGIRCMAFRRGGAVDLLSRNGKRLNDAYPELIVPLRRQESRSFVIDGEVVALQDGVASFSLLQQRMQVRDPCEAQRRGVAVIYYVFDLPFLGERDLRSVPLIERKALLQENFQFEYPLRFTEHRDGDGIAFFEEACRSGLEGTVGKRASSVYISQRSRDWVKFRCSAQQELVIAGYTDPQGDRAGLGALLLGYYEGGRLFYAGKAGTGFDTRTLLDLRGKLERLEVKQSPFAERVKERAHWVKPRMVAQIAFTEWTRDGKLRHPRFLGIRKDKAASEVVREKPG